jgi:hypothetical protein
MTNLLPVVTFLVFFRFFFLPSQPNSADFCVGFIYGILGFFLIFVLPGSVINRLHPGTRHDEAKLQIRQRSFMEEEEAQAVTGQTEAQTVRNEEEKKTQNSTPTTFKLFTSHHNNITMQVVESLS